MPIIRDLTLTVNNNKSSLSDQVYIYRGDRGIELHIKIQQFKFKFGKKVLENMVDDTIVAARAIVLGPKHIAHDGQKPTSDQKNPDDDKDLGTCFEIPARVLENNTIVIDVNETWVDEVHETGTHTIQIQLYGEALRKTDGKVTDYERVTIPPVTFEVLELLCDYEETGKLKPADPSQQPTIDYGFDEETNTYKPYGFETGDIIPFDALNAMEEALVYTTTDLKEGLAQEIVDRTNADKSLNFDIVKNRTEINASKTRISTLEERVDFHFEEMNERLPALKEDLIEYTDGKVATAKSDLELLLQQESRFLQQEDDKLNRLISSEISDRKTADGNLQKNIDALQTKHDGEVAELRSKDIQLDNAIGQLRSDLSNHANEAAQTLRETKAELQGEINSLTAKHDADKTQLTKKIEDTEISLNSKISDLSAEHDVDIAQLRTYVDGELEQEMRLRESADNGLSGRIDSAMSSIGDEAADRTAADALLQSNIDREIETRATEDAALQSSIDSEVAARTSSDTAIWQAIENLTTTHNDDKTELSDKIASNKEAISSEALERKADIAALDTKHTNLNETLKTTIDGEIKTAIADLQLTINDEIVTKIDELDKEIDTEIKTSIDHINETVYTKDETEERIKWVQENVRGPQGTSILRYMGTLNSEDELVNVPQVEGDSYFIGTTVYVCNGPDGPQPIWNSVDLRGPQGFWYIPNIIERIENGVPQHFLTWSNNAPEGVLSNPNDFDITNYVYTPHIEERLNTDGSTQQFLTWTNNAPEGMLNNPNTIDVTNYVYTPHISVDEYGSETILSWTNNAPEGQMINPPATDIKGKPIKIIYSETEPEDKDMLWAVDSEQEEYATRDYVDKRNFIKSDSCTHVEFVKEYPEEEDMQPGVLYILYEPIED